MILIGKPILRPTSKGHSFFKFISDYWQSKDPKSNNRTIHRLCSLMRKMGSQQTVIEEIDINSPELLQERDALIANLGEGINFKVFRFTFLSEKISNITDIKNLGNDKFLASAVLINLSTSEDNWYSYLQQAIVCKPKIFTTNTKLQNYYIHVFRDFDCFVNITQDEEHPFKIQGTFFCQQNSITSVCAHASLCMTINNLLSQEKKLISTEEINKILKIDHKRKKFNPEEGLDDKQVVKVLKRAGFKAKWYSFFEYPNTDYAEYIYRYIEGGCPVLLVFTTSKNAEGKLDRHVVSIIGHNFNSDSWRAEAELAYKEASPLNCCPSSSWVNNFIIHDDNFGMYLCLPIDSLRKILIERYDPEFRPHIAIAVVPAEIHTPPHEAERAAAIIVRTILATYKSAGVKLDEWTKQLADPRRPIVLRTLLANKKKYKEHLASEEDFEGNSFKNDEINAMTDHLPEYFWLTEITLPDIYTANKNKIIDFIYRCDKNPTDNIKEMFKRWIQIRFPEACHFNKNGATPIIFSVKSHYPIYRNFKDIETPEW
ncbi:MAG: hypothetical protein ABIB41_01195 [Nitrospirota bacterium]